MKTVALTLFALIGIVGISAIFIIVAAVGYSNNEIRLRSSFHAQEKNNESSFDKMWKVIQQQAGVAETERESFRNTYVDIMNSTRGVAGNGQLASFFTQAKVDISPKLFEQLMNSIEAQRESFHRDQQKLISIHKMHSDSLTTAPSSLICGWREPLTLKLVTSTRTESAFSTGKDDNTDLFNGKKGD